MSGEFNDQIRRQLIQIIATPDSNSPEFTFTAEFGGHRKNDEGLQNLLPARFTLYEKKRRLKGAIVDFLVAGGIPSIEDAGGDMGTEKDAALFFHFHIQVMGVPLFIKVSYDRRGSDEPKVKVINLHRQD